MASFFCAFLTITTLSLRLSEPCQLWKFLCIVENVQIQPVLELSCGRLCQAYDTWISLCIATIWGESSP